MLQKKSVLARLLANENISVQQGNYSTASFDIVNRVMRLPLWKDMSNDLYDLLVGHEVSHALHTPSDPNVLNVPNVPFSFINIVEDIRIEKKILRKYPGLIGNFTRGYDELFEMDLFGTKDKDLNTLPFMDKLNIKSKGRAAVEVDFTDEEKPYFDKAMAVETFDDVREVVLEIAAWLRSKNEEPEEAQSDVQAPQPPSDEKGDQSDSMPSPSDDGDEGEDEPESDGGDQTKEAGDDEAEKETESGGSPDNSESESDEDDIDETKESNPSKGAGGDSHSYIKDVNNGADDLDEASTEIAQQENMSDLTEVDGKLYVQPLSREEYETYKIPFSDVIESREKMLEDRAENYPRRTAEAQEKWEKFQADAKPIVSLMAKEFEMRKAAYRSKRARTSTKGTLDVAKLHAYKYDDNLFKQVTTLADGKSHGLMMLVDYSGSMNNVMPAVIRQTATLVMFCKRVGIPFQVFGFTSIQTSRKIMPNHKTDLSRYDSDELSLIELYSSKMTKRQLEFSLKASIYQSSDAYYFTGRYEQLGNTPLNSAIMAMTYAMKDFRKENPVEKMRLITLTDGDSNRPTVTRGSDYPDNATYSTPIVTEINGTKIEFGRQWDIGKEATGKILKAVCGKDVTTVNFFITDRRYVNAELYRLYPWQQAQQNAAKKSLRDDGALVIDNDLGYDRRFIMVDKGASLSGSTEDLEVSNDATPAQIAKAFKKFSGSKKGNRIITRKFAEMLA